MRPGVSVLVPASRIGAMLVIALLAVAALLARRAGLDGSTLQRELVGLGLYAVPVFILALTVSFLVARRLVVAARATREPWRPGWRVLRRMFERVEARPVSSIALLRLVLWLAPPLTYALAATKVRARDHLIGCAVGLVARVIAANLIGGLV